LNPIPVLIIPVLNRYDLLDNLLNSINYPVDNIFVVDNGGSYKIDMPNVTVMNMPTNIGVAASWNLGIKCYPHTEYWTFTAIDAGLLPDTLEKTTVYSNENVMVISNYGFSYFSIGRDIIQKVGLFDENYFPAYYEDTDFEKRVRAMGYASQIIYPDVNIKLLGTTVTVKSNPQYAKRKQETDLSNQHYLNKKFAGYDWTCYNWDLQRRIDNDWERS
jgi:GT2 family glycosyltransferase